MMDVIWIDSKISGTYFISDRGLLQKDRLWLNNIKLGVFIYEYIHTYLQRDWWWKEFQNILTTVIFELVRFNLV